MVRTFEHELFFPFFQAFAFRDQGRYFYNVSIHMNFDVQYKIGIVACYYQAFFNNPIDKKWLRKLVYFQICVWRFWREQRRDYRVWRVYYGAFRHFAWHSRWQIEMWVGIQTRKFLFFEEKIKFSTGAFRLYDLDGDGSITRNEMLEIVKGMQFNLKTVINNLTTDAYEHRGHA